MSTIYKYSALGSVYKNEVAEYLDSALESVFSQSVTPDEVILIVDGEVGTDITCVISDHVVKNDLKVFYLSENMGLATALNYGLKLCRNDLVMRFDTDDVCNPERAKIQCEYLSKNPDITLVSGQVRECDPSTMGEVSRRLVPSTGVLKPINFALYNPINHPAVMYRKAAVEAVAGYNVVYPEDYLLWIRLLAAKMKMVNLPQVLVDMRCGHAFYQRRGFKFFRGELVAGSFFVSKFPFYAPYVLVGLLTRMVLRALPQFCRSGVYIFIRICQKIIA